MELEKFIKKNSDTFQVKVSDIVEQNGGAMTWDKIPNVKGATVKITIDTQENIQISDTSFFVETDGAIKSTQEEGKTVIEFNYTPHKHDPFGQSLYFEFLSEMINIESTDCSDLKNIHFTTDIKFQNYDDSYLVNEHREFDFNPCHIM
ncbi:hypothetical protein [Wolbachia endosymbiont (group A) of Myopa testacea]|uniref:hypothetical protein n=1 Tax=Wolbachia endosymbiont (group A) of Myopa testacea TaxID=3066148 RepID=UPI0033423AA5